MLISWGTGAFTQNKRGTANGYHSRDDLEVLTPGASWWYNWSEAAEGSDADVYQNYNCEFISDGKPIWFKEFAGWEQNGNINNLSDQINFMNGQSTYLNQTPPILYIP